MDVEQTPAKLQKMFVIGLGKKHLLAAKSSSIQRAVDDGLVKEVEDITCTLESAEHEIQELASRPPEVALVGVAFVVRTLTRLAMRIAVVEKKGYPRDFGRRMRKGFRTTAAKAPPTS